MKTSLKKIRIANKKGSRFRATSSTLFFGGVHCYADCFKLIKKKSKSEKCARSDNDKFTGSRHFMDYLNISIVEESNRSCLKRRSV